MLRSYTEVSSGSPASICQILEFVTSESIAFVLSTPNPGQNCSAIRGLGGQNCSSIRGCGEVAAPIAGRLDESKTNRGALIQEWQAKIMDTFKIITALT